MGLLLLEVTIILIIVKSSKSIWLVSMFGMYVALSIEQDFKKESVFSVSRLLRHKLALFQWFELLLLLLLHV